MKIITLKKGILQKFLLTMDDKEAQAIILKEIINIKYGKNQKNIEKIDGKYPVLGSNGEINKTDQFLCFGPSVLIGRKGTINKPQYIETPFWAVDTVFYTEISKTCNPKYLFYIFSYINWKKYKNDSVMPSLDRITIENIEILLPSLKKQEKIVEILSTVDEQITVYEEKKSLLKALKQGILDQFLSGVIET